MAVLKVIEVLAQSDKSWEDAAKQAIDDASKSIRNIKSLYVENMQVAVNDGKLAYRLDAKITFAVDAEHREAAVAGRG
jgi:flavin-binding protein dodecin